MLDDESEIIDYYPSDFQIDMNGKKMAWQGVALLPFIDEKRLLKALDERYPQLTEDEVRRNGFGDHTLFVSEDSRLYDALCALYAKRKNTEVSVSSASCACERQSWKLMSVHISSHTAYAAQCCAERRHDRSGEARPGLRARFDVRLSSLVTKPTRHLQRPIPFRPLRISRTTNAASECIAQRRQGAQEASYCR